MQPQKRYKEINDEHGYEYECLGIGIYKGKKKVIKEVEV